MNNAFINNLKNENGQSFVEFVLLLAIVVILSLGFLKTVNTGVAKFWKNSAKIIIDNESINLKLRGE